MIGKIMTGLMTLVINLISLLLSPIDLLITNALPSLSNWLDSINALIDYLIQGMGYVVDLTGLSNEAINLIIVYYSFVLVVPLGVYLVKLALKWYRILMP